MLKEVAHHDDWQYQASNEERDAKDETNCGSLTEGKTDNQASYEKNQPKNNAERKAIGTIESTFRFRYFGLVGVHSKTSWIWKVVGKSLGLGRSDFYTGAVRLVNVSPPDVREGSGLSANFPISSDEVSTVTR